MLVHARGLSVALREELKIKSDSTLQRRKQAPRRRFMMLCSSARTGALRRLLCSSAARPVDRG